MNYIDNINVKGTVYEIQDTALSNTTADELRQLIKCNLPVQEETGNFIIINNTIEEPLIDLKIYGKNKKNNDNIIVACKDGKLPMGTVNINLAYMERGALNTSGEEIESTTAWRSHFFPILSNFIYASKDYIYSDTTCNLTAFFYDVNMTYLGNVIVMDYNKSQQAIELSTITEITDAAFVRFVQVYPNSSNSPDTTKLMITFADSGEEEYPGHIKACGSDTTLLMPGNIELRGLPVEETDSWNYQDKNGQFWICDEVNYGTGTYTRRIGKTTFNNLLGVSHIGNGVFKTNAPAVTYNFENHIMTRIYESVESDSSLEEGQIHAINDGAHVEWRDSRFITEDDPVAAMLAVIGDEPIYYMLRSPNTNYMTDEQKNSFNMLRSQNNMTRIFTKDGAQPDFTVTVVSKQDNVSKIKQLEELVDALVYDRSNGSQRTDHGLFITNQPVDNTITGTAEIKVIGPQDELTFTWKKMNDFDWVDLDDSDITEDLTDIENEIQGSRITTNSTVSRLYVCQVSFTGYDTFVESRRVSLCKSI